MLLPLTPIKDRIESLLTDWQHLFYTMYDEIPADIREENNSWCEIKPNGGDCSQPRPVLFSWYCDKFEDKIYHLHISKTPDFAEERNIRVWDALCQPVWNLELDTEYFWYVDKTGASGYEKSNISTFRTAQEYPRFLMIPDGVSNVRDLGGLVSFDGHRIRQGLLFRGEYPGARIDKTGKGEAVFCDELGIRTQIDLRGVDNEDTTEIHPVFPADRVAWHLCPIHGYEAIDFDCDRASFREIFTLLCDPRNLPLYFNCYIGVDRTGTVAAMVQLLLHVPVKWIDVDYELSSLGSSDWACRKHKNVDVLILGTVTKVTGIDDPYLAAEAFVIDRWGITQNQIDTLRQTFWET